MSGSGFPAASPVEAKGDSEIPPILRADYRTIGRSSAIKDSPDEGLLLEHCRHAGFLESRGWTSVRDVMETTAIDVVRSVDGRENCRVVDPNSGRLIAYLKRHRHPVRTSSGTVDSPGIAEAVAAEMCSHAGVLTMNVIATGSRHVSDSSGQVVEESFVLTEPAGDQSGYELIGRWNAAGRRQSPDVIREKIAMTRVAAKMVRRLHDHGLFHQDLYWSHFYFFKNDSGGRDVRVIDLQRIVHPGGLIRWYFWLKDMDQARFSMQAMWFSEEEIQEWYRAYFEVPEKASLPSWARLLAGLIRLRGLRRSRNYRRRFQQQPPEAAATAVAGKSSTRNADSV